MELKLNQKKFIEDLLSRLTANEPARVAIEYALQEQGMRFYNGAVVPIMNPTFDSEHNTENKNAKFKVGDWVIGRATSNEPRQIAEITEEGYKSTYGGWYGFSFEEDMHLWTIRDAKKGDILEFVDHGRLVVGIVSFVNERTGKVDVSCLLEDNKFKIGNFYALDTINPHPATKEQRDILMKAMADAGYTFDFEKKELKNGQNTSWSREDEQNLKAALGYIDDEYLRRWLKDAIYNKYENPSWSEEDEHWKQKAIDFIKHPDLIKATPTLAKDTIDWLKSLRPQNN